VSAAASATDEGVYCTLSNRALDARTVRIDVDGIDPSSVEATALFAERDPSAIATAADAASFASEEWPVDVEGGRAVVEAPPSSVVAVELEA